MNPCAADEYWTQWRDTQVQLAQRNRLWLAPVPFLTQQVDHRNEILTFTPEVVHRGCYALTLWIDVGDDGVPIVLAHISTEVEGSYFTSILWHD